MRRKIITAILAIVAFLAFYATSFEAKTALMQVVWSGACIIIFLGAYKLMEVVAPDDLKQEDI